MPYNDNYDADGCDAVSRWALAMSKSVNEVEQNSAEAVKDLCERNPSVCK